MNSSCDVKNNIDITGCRVSLYPMSDGYSDIIIQAVEKTDTKAVWSRTDLFSTLFRGKQKNVINAVEGLYRNAYEANIHSVCELTFSKGCPGDSEGDQFLKMPQDKENKNQNLKNFNVQCKYSFYTFGEADYMNQITHIVEMAEKSGLNPTSAHYVTLLEGSAEAIFAYFDEALAYAHENIGHYVLEATLSVNSPSLKGEKHAEK